MHIKKAYTFKKKINVSKFNLKKKSTLLKIKNISVALSIMPQNLLIVVIILFSVFKLIYFLIAQNSFQFVRKLIYSQLIHLFVLHNSQDILAIEV